MFAVSRSWAPTAAMSQKIRLYSTDVRPSARPATIHTHMPAIEIAFGDTFRDASHAVAACAHFRFRVAMGRRSIAFVADSVIADAIHSRVERRWPDQHSVSVGTRRNRMRSPLAQHAFLRDDAEPCLQRWNKPGRI